MLVVETIARIRREFFVQGKTIKEIVRDLKVSRNTVRKVLRSGATAFAYEREVQPLPKLGLWREELDGLLGMNEAKPARERLTLIRLFEELRGLAYEGGYDAVRRYARGWQRDHAAAAAAAFVPLSFAPGEAYQFDWSHEVVLLNGTTATDQGGARPSLSQPDVLRAGLSIRARRRRWHSTRTTGRSPSSRARADAGSTTT
jgi:hypothetical protein